MQVWMSMSVHNRKLGNQFIAYMRCSEGAVFAMAAGSLGSESDARVGTVKLGVYNLHVSTL